MWLQCLLLPPHPERLQHTCPTTRGTGEARILVQSGNLPPPHGFAPALLSRRSGAVFLVEGIFPHVVAYCSFLSSSDAGGFGRRQHQSISPMKVHTPASTRTARRAQSGFSSRIGSQGATHGSWSVIETCRCKASVRKAKEHYRSAN